MLACKYYTIVSANWFDILSILCMSKNTIFVDNSVHFAVIRQLRMVILPSKLVKFRYIQIAYFVKHDLAERKVKLCTIAKKNKVGSCVDHGCSKVRKYPLKLRIEDRNLAF